MPPARNASCVPTSLEGVLRASRDENNPCSLDPLRSRDAVGVKHKPASKRKGIVRMPEGLPPFLRFPPLLLCDAYWAHDGFVEVFGGLLGSRRQLRDAGALAVRSVGGSLDLS